MNNLASSNCSLIIFVTLFVSMNTCSRSMKAYHRNPISLEARKNRSENADNMVVSDLNLMPTIASTLPDSRKMNKEQELEKNMGQKLIKFIGGPSEKQEKSLLESTANRFFPLYQSILSPEDFTTHNFDDVQLSALSKFFYTLFQIKHPKVCIDIETRRIILSPGIRTGDFGCLEMNEEEEPTRETKNKTKIDRSFTFPAFDMNASTSTGQTTVDDNAIKLFETSPASALSSQGGFDLIKFETIPWLKDYATDRGIMFPYLTEKMKEKSNETEYLVPMEDETINSKRYPCTVKGQSGFCRYLIFCPMKDFLNNLTLYMEEYFCQIQRHAGVCCPSFHKFPEGK